MFCINKIINYYNNSKFSKVDLLSKIKLFSIILFFIFIFYQGLDFAFSNKNNFGEIIKESKFNDFLNNKFQNNIEQKIKDTGRFSKNFRIINNTILFKLFSSTTSGIVIGKNDYLFGKDYITEKLALDFPDENKIKELAEKIKKTQDILNKDNIKFLYIIAPTKVDFYTEFLPEKLSCLLKNNNESKRQYYLLKKYLKEYNVNFVDANEFLLNKKDKTEYLLFSKYGVHWSYYGFYEFFNEVLNKKYFDNSITCELYFDDIPLGSDFDLGNLVGLKRKIFPLDDLAYFNNCKTNKKLPKLLLAGDSFSDIFYSDNNLRKMFEDDTKYFRIWYYKDTYDFNGNISAELNTDEKINIIKNKDIIFFINTTPNILNEDLIKFFDDVVNNFEEE